jgi:hypothetical protein
MKTEPYEYSGYPIELEYQEQEGAFWPNRFQVRVPVGGNAEWQGEVYSQASYPTEEECIAAMQRDARKYVDAL